MIRAFAYQAIFAFLCVGIGLVCGGLLEQVMASREMAERVGVLVGFGTFLTGELYEWF